MSYQATRSDVKKLAAQVEMFAKKVQADIDNQVDYLTSVTEVVRLASTITFAVGNLSALESKSVKPVKPTNKNYHNVRDAKGRFARV